MINAQVVNFWKGVNLETGESISKVTIRLPGGLEVEQEVPEGYLTVLLESAAPDEPTANVVSAVSAQANVKAVAPPQQQYVEPEEAVEEETPMQESVLWGSLPEAVLPDIVKFAFKDQGLPDRLPAAQVLQIRDAFLSEYSEGDWQRIVSRYSEDQEAPEEEAEEAPEVIPAPQKPVRRNAAVEWGEGSVMRPSVPSRTVPKDAMGYPIVQRTANEVDPGELAAGAEDDGVEDF